MRSIRSNLVVSILLPVLMVFIIIALLFVTYMGNVTNNNANAEMVSAAVQSGNSIDSVLLNIETKVKMIDVAVEELSDDSRIIAGDMDYFKSFESEINKILVESTKDIDGLVASYIRYEPDLTYGTSGTFYTDADGDGTLETVVPTDLLQYDQNDMEHVGWFYEPLKNRSSMWMEPYYNANIDKTIISYVTPFYLDNGENFGIIGVDFGFEYINNLLLENQKYHEGDTYIINEAGKILYHPDYSDGEHFGEIYSGRYGEAVADIAENVSGFINEKAGREHVLLGYSSLKSTGWKLCVTPTYGEIYGSFVKLKIFLAVFMVIAVFLMFMISVLLGNRIAKPILSITNSVKNMANGNLDEIIDIESKNEIGLLANDLKRLVYQLKQYQVYIAEVTSILNELQSGNLDVKLVNDYSGEFSKIKDALNELSRKLTYLIGSIKLSSDQVSNSAGQVLSGAQTLAQGTTVQASSIEELSATITEISQQIKHNADNANIANNEALATEEEVKNSNMQMQEMKAAMSNIKAKSTESSKIVKTIADIAFQTNILALNAAVEAARAGASGKGFAVVADEVRNLAQKSAEAAQNTTVLIEETVQAVEYGTKMADSTAESMKNVVEGTHKVNSLINEIAEAFSEQANNVSQVTIGIDQISSVVQHNSATAEGSAAASEELKGQAELLKNQVSQFKLKEDIG